MIAVAQLRGARSPKVVSPLLSQQLFLIFSALVFVASATVTVEWCGAMSVMRGMPMAGGWTMSMAWMRMPGQTWFSAGASFVGMWTVMMVAMMLPSLLPMLRGFRQAVGEMRVNKLTAIVGAGYFFVWTMLGTAVFPLGVILAIVEMHHPALARAVPATTGAIIMIAGTLQFTPWKAHHLAGCREARGCHRLDAHSRSALRHGVNLGLECSCCCVGLTAILVAGGVMNLRLMIIVAGAITAERLAPNAQRVARAIGAVAMVAGVLLIARAVAVS